MLRSFRFRNQASQDKRLHTLTHNDENVDMQTPLYVKIMQFDEFRLCRVFEFTVPDVGNKFPAHPTDQSNEMGSNRSKILARGVLNTQMYHKYS